MTTSYSYSFLVNESYEGTSTGTTGDDHILAKQLPACQRQFFPFTKKWERVRVSRCRRSKDHGESSTTTVAADTLYIMGGSRLFGVDLKDLDKKLKRLAGSAVENPIHPLLTYNMDLEGKGFPIGSVPMKLDSKIFLVGGMYLPEVDRSSDVFKFDSRKRELIPLSRKMGPKSKPIVVTIEGSTYVLGMEYNGYYSGWIDHLRPPSFEVLHPNSKSRQPDSEDFHNFFQLPSNNSSVAATDVHNLISFDVAAASSPVEHSCSGGGDSTSVADHGSGLYQGPHTVGGYESINEGTYQQLARMTTSYSYPFVINESHEGSIIGLLEMIIIWPRNYQLQGTKIIMCTIRVRLLQGIIYSWDLGNDGWPFGTFYP
ncbi:hypothetical protein Dimus_031669 [Dionaea muscipula]